MRNNIPNEDDYGDGDIPPVDLPKTKNTSENFRGVVFEINNYLFENLIYRF